MPDIQTTQLYVLADGRYYEAPYQIPDAATRFPLADALACAGWRRLPQGLWTLIAPLHHRSPDQGWKFTSRPCRRRRSAHWQPLLMYVTPQVCRSSSCEAWTRCG